MFILETIHFLSRVYRKPVAVAMIVKYFDDLVWLVYGV
jgi:hypothetical protein